MLKRFLIYVSTFVIENSVGITAIIGIIVSLASLVISIMAMVKR